jgi:hypothetical protein
MSSLTKTFAFTLNNCKHISITQLRKLCSSIRPTIYIIRIGLLLLLKDIYPCLNVQTKCNFFQAELFYYEKHLLWVSIQSGNDWRLRERTLKNPAAMIKTFSRSHCRWNHSESKRLIESDLHVQLSSEWILDTKSILRTAVTTSLILYCGKCSQSFECKFDSNQDTLIPYGQKPWAQNMCNAAVPKPPADLKREK